MSNEQLEYVESVAQRTRDTLSSIADGSLRRRVAGLVDLVGTNTSTVRLGDPLYVLVPPEALEAILDLFDIMTDRLDDAG